MNSTGFTTVPFGPRQPQQPRPPPDETIRRRPSYIYYPQNPPIVPPPPGFHPAFSQLQGPRPPNPSQFHQRLSNPRPAFQTNHQPTVEPHVHYTPPGFRSGETLFNLGLTPVQLYENYYRVYFINFHTFSGTFDNDARGFHPLSLNEFLEKYNRCSGVTPDAEAREPHNIGSMLESMMTIHDPTWTPKTPDSFTTCCHKLIYDAVVAHMDQIKQSVCTKYLAHRGRCGSGAGDGWPTSTPTRASGRTPPGFEHPSYTSPWSRSHANDRVRQEPQSSVTRAENDRWAQRQTSMDYLSPARFGQPASFDSGTGSGVHDPLYMPSMGKRWSKPEPALAPMPTHDEFLQKLRAVHRAHTSDYRYDLPTLEATSKPPSEAGYTSSNPDSVFYDSPKVNYLPPPQNAESEEKKLSSLQEYPELTVIPLKRKRVEDQNPVSPWEPPASPEFRLKEKFLWPIKTESNDPSERRFLYVDSPEQVPSEFKGKPVIEPIPFVNPFEDESYPETSNCASPNVLIHDTSSVDTIGESKDHDGLIEISDEEPDCWESRVDTVEEEKSFSTPILTASPIGEHKEEEHKEEISVKSEIQIKPCPSPPVTVTPRLVTTPPSPVNIPTPSPKFIDIQNDPVEFPPLPAYPPCPLQNLKISQPAKKPAEVSRVTVTTPTPTKPMKLKKKRHQSPPKHIPMPFKSKPYKSENVNSSIPSLLDLVLDGPEKCKNKNKKQKGKQVPVPAKPTPIRTPPTRIPPLIPRLVDPVPVPPPDPVPVVEPIPVVEPSPAPEEYKPRVYDLRDWAASPEPDTIEEPFVPPELPSGVWAANLPPGSTKKDPFIVIDRERLISVDSSTETIDYDEYVEVNLKQGFKKPFIIIHNKHIDCKVRPKKVIKTDANGEKTETPVLESKDPALRPKGSATAVKASKAAQIDKSGLIQGEASSTDRPLNSSAFQSCQKSGNSTGEPVKHVSNLLTEPKPEIQISTDPPVEPVESTGKTSVWIRNVNRGKGKRRTERNQKKRARNRQAQVQRAQSGQQQSQSQVKTIIEESSDEDNEETTEAPPAVKEDQDQAPSVPVRTTLVTNAAASSQTTPVKQEFENAISASNAQQLSRLVHPTDTSMITKQEKYTVKVDQKVQRCSACHAAGTSGCAACGQIPIVKTNIAKPPPPEVFAEVPKKEEPVQTTTSTETAKTVETAKEIKTAEPRKTNKAIRRLFTRAAAGLAKFEIERSEVVLEQAAVVAVSPAPVSAIVQARKKLAAKKSVPILQRQAQPLHVSARKEATGGPRVISVPVPALALSTSGSVNPRNVTLSSQCSGTCPRDCSRHIYLVAVGPGSDGSPTGTKYDLCLLRTDFDRCIAEFTKFKKEYGYAKEGELKDMISVEELRSYCDEKFPTQVVSAEKLHGYLCGIRSGVFKIPDPSVDIRSLVKSLSKKDFLEIFIGGALACAENLAKSPKSKEVNLSDDKKPRPKPRMKIDNSSRSRPENILDSPKRSTMKLGRFMSPRPMIQFTSMHELGTLKEEDRIQPSQRSLSVPNMVWTAPSADEYPVLTASGQLTLDKAVQTSDLVYPSPADLMMASEQPGPLNLRSVL